MTEFLRKYVDSLSHEKLKEEHLTLLQRYEEQTVAMQDTGDVVRSLYEGSEVSKRISHLTMERDEALKECNEQARLNGMGASRELKLITERNTLIKGWPETLTKMALLTAELDELRAQLENEKRNCDNILLDKVSKRFTLIKERDEARAEAAKAKDYDLTAAILAKDMETSDQLIAECQKSAKLEAELDEARAEATSAKARIQDASRDYMAERARSQKLVEALKFIANENYYKDTTDSTILMLVDTAYEALTEYEDKK